MLDKNLNPPFLNDFLDFNQVILNKSINTIKEYNYDLLNFFKYIFLQKSEKKIINEKEINFQTIIVSHLPTSFLKEISLNDIYKYISYLATAKNAKSATRARKIASIRVFFNYITNKTDILEINPAQNLETPKIEKRLPKYLSLDDSKKLLEVTFNDERRK